MIIAKIVRSDGHLSVQFPDGFPLEGTEVSVRKDGAAVILEQIGADPSWSKIAAWLDEPREPLDADMIAAINEDPGPAEERDFHLLG